MRLKQAFFLLLTLCASLMLAGCDSSKSKKNGGGSQDRQQIMIVPSLENSAEQESIISNGSGAVLYDRCGVRLVLTRADTGSGELFVEVENTTDGKLTLCSMYMIEGDAMGLDADSLRMPMQARETVEGKFALTQGAGILRTRLYLLDEDYSIVEGSISDTITLELSELRWLYPAPLGRLVYEDDSIKLIHTDTVYRENSNTVTLHFTAFNKTDRDLYISQWGAVCEHADYRFTFGGYLPANSRTDLTGRALTNNNTITSADLDGITFTLRRFEAEDHLLHPYLAEPTAEAEGVSIVLDRSGKPVVSVPDTITPAGPLDEYREYLLGEDDGTSELPAPKYEAVFENDSIRIEYVLGAEGRYDDVYACALGFKCTNKLKKQIRLEAVGTVNGATADFSCYDSLPAMTEDYITLAILDMPDPEKFGGFADAEIMFTVEYDDGHSDENSFICSVPKMKIVTGERADTSGALDGAKNLYSDDNCELWLLGTKIDGKYADLEFYALNKSDRTAVVYLTLDDADLFLYASIEILPHTFTVTEERLRTMTDAEITDSDIEQLEFLSDIYLIARGEP